jgi:HEAT repeat protein
MLAIVLPVKRILYKFPWTSMYGISRLRHAEPIRHYTELLQSRRTAARWNAVVALGDTADIAALSALGIALSDRAWRVRRDAANSIRRLRHFGATTVWPSHDARDQLVARLEDPHNLVAIAAAQALWSLNDHEPVRSAAQSLPHRHQEFLAVMQGDIPNLGPMWAADDHL